MGVECGYISFPPSLEAYCWFPGNWGDFCPDHPQGGFPCNLLFNGRDQRMVGSARRYRSDQSARRSPWTIKFSQDDREALRAIRLGQQFRLAETWRRIGAPVRTAYGVVAKTDAGGISVRFHSDLAARWIGGIGASHERQVVQFRFPRSGKEWAGHFEWKAGSPRQGEATVNICLYDGPLNGKPFLPDERIEIVRETQIVGSCQVIASQFGSTLMHEPEIPNANHFDRIYVRLRQLLDPDFGPVN